MIMAKSKEETIISSRLVDDSALNLTGADKDAFIADREATAQASALLETEQRAKQEARASAITKLAEIAGLTEEELASIL
jgi:hypothetical protein